MNESQDQRPRCSWAVPGRADPRMVEYHDIEWGVPVHDDSDLFERLALEGFQAGLSWQTILNKRPAFRVAFRAFDPAVVATFREEDRARLLADAGIVRNRAKVDATIENAQIVLELSRAHGSFDRYLRSIVPEPAVPLPAGTEPGQIPATTPASDRLSADLRKHGMRFVGSTIIYSFMQSVGVVDDHLPNCFRYRGQRSGAGAGDA